MLQRPSLETKRYYPKTGETKGKIDVNTIKLDDFVEANNISHINILKIDIQGAEKMAFEGAENLLKNSKVDIIYFETMFVELYESNPLFNELWEFLSKFDYSIYALHNLNFAYNGQVKYGDAILGMSH